jgi:chemotaxis protein histidine kinase CheA
MRTAIDAIRTRVQAELDAQIAAISDQHAQALAEAQRAAEIEAEQRWSAKVEAVRAEWTTRLDTEVAAARAEAERRIIAESTRIRMEAEQAAAESAARVREELEQALAAERQRAQSEIQAERQRAESDLQRQREELQAASRAEGEAQSAVVTEARAAERQSQLAGIERLLASVREISAAESLSDTLLAMLKGAAAEAPRAAVFIANGDRLQGFKDAGFSGVPPCSLSIPASDSGALGEALRRGTAVTASADSDPGAPRFAALPPDRAGLAVPVVVGDRAVAVLYADDGGDAAPVVPASWPESVQILGRHAAACLSHLTAVRTAQAMRMSAAMGAHGAHAETTTEDDNGARRYARLLVSEIKLYNEPAVRLGRQKRDLATRLRPEIERARRLYEERVPQAVAGRAAYFQQELVQTLADGDASLLGS